MKEIDDHFKTNKDLSNEISKLAEYYSSPITNEAQFKSEIIGILKN